MNTLATVLTLLIITTLVFFFVFYKALKIYKKKRKEVKVSIESFILQESVTYEEENLRDLRVDIHMYISEHRKHISSTDMATLHAVHGRIEGKLDYIDWEDNFSNLTDK